MLRLEPKLVYLIDPFSAAGTEWWRVGGAQRAEGRLHLLTLGPGWEPGRKQRWFVCLIVVFWAWSLCRKVGESKKYLGKSNRFFSLGKTAETEPGHTMQRLAGVCSCLRALQHGRDRVMCRNSHHRDAYQPFQKKNCLILAVFYICTENLLIYLGSWNGYLPKRCFLT